MPLYSNVPVSSGSKASTFFSQQSSVHFVGKIKEQEAEERPGQPFSSECSQHLPGHWDGASAWRQDKGSRWKEKFPEAGRRACREESRAREGTAGCSPISHSGLLALAELGYTKAGALLQPTVYEWPAGSLELYRCKHCQIHTWMCIKP